MKLRPPLSQSLFALLLASLALLPLAALAAETCSLLYAALTSSALPRLQGLPDTAGKAAYRGRLASYFGAEKLRLLENSKGAPDPFDHLWSEFEALARKQPAWLHRAFSAREEGKAFTLKTEGNSSGLALKEEAFANFFTDWKARLAEDAKAKGDLPQAAQEKANSEVLAAWGQKAQDLLAQEKNKKRTGSGQTARDFFNLMAEDPDFRRASAAALLQRLEEEELFRTPVRDADALLQWWEKARKGALWDAADPLVPASLRAQIARRLVPELALPKAELIAGKPAESALFRAQTYTNAKGKLNVVGSTNSAYSFTPPQQRFDCVFKGLFSQECVGGGAGSFRSLSPERWATCLLKDSLFFQMEKKGRYQGFVQVVPVTIDGKTFGSVELGAQAFARSPALTNEVLAELRAQMPKQWAGLVVGENEAMSQAVASRAVWANPAYWLGTKIGKPESARVEDPLAESLTKGRIRQGYDLRYGGHVITDATIRGAGQLVQLSEGTPAELALALRNPDSLWALARGSDRKREGLAAYLSGPSLGDRDKASLLANLKQSWQRGKVDASTTLTLRQALAPAGVEEPWAGEWRLKAAAGWLRARALLAHRRQEWMNKAWNGLGHLHKPVPLPAL